MKIPVGEFGNRLAERGPSPAIGQESFGGGVPQAVDELAQGVGAAGRAAAGITAANEHDAARVLHEQVIEAKQLDREAKRAQAMTIHAQAQNDLATESDRIRLGIADGTIHKDEAPKLWSDTSKKIVDGYMGKVDRANADLVRAGLENDLGVHGRQIGASVIQRNRHDIGAGLQQYLEQQERFAVTDLRTAVKQAHMAIDGLGPQAGLNPEQIAKAKQGFTEAATFNVSRKFLLENRNNAGALNSFLKALPANKDLDPQKATILEGQAMQYITHLENKAIAAENRRTARAQVALTRITTLIDNGLTPDPAEVAGAVQLAKGTPFEPDAVGLINDQKRMADLLKLPPQEQVNLVNEARAQFMKDGAPRAEWASLARMERTVKRTVEQMQTQPLAYAANRTGAEIAPLDLMKPDTWGDNLRNRSTVLLGQRRQLGGQSSLAGLLPEEVDALKSVLKNATPAVQADTLAKLRQGFGDAAVFRATLAQIAPDDPVTAKAGIFAANDRQSQAGKSVAVEILTGAQLLRPDPKEDGKPGKGGVWPMPSDDKFEREWANFTGDAYRKHGNLRNADFQTAKAIYAARSAAEGDQNKDVVNSRRWRASMALVTGGVTNYNGLDIILPYGMTTGEFKDGVAQRAAAYKVDPSIGNIASLPLELTDRDGVYAVSVGDSLLLDDKKRPVLIDMNAPPPPRAQQTNTRRAVESAARRGLNTPGAGQ